MLVCGGTRLSLYLSEHESTTISFTTDYRYSGIRFVRCVLAFARAPASLSIDANRSARRRGSVTGHQSVSGRTFPEEENTHW